MWPHRQSLLWWRWSGNWADCWLYGTRVRTRVGHTGPGYPSTRVLTSLITSENGRRVLLKLICSSLRLTIKCFYFLVFFYFLKFILPFVWLCNARSAGFYLVWLGTITFYHITYHIIWMTTCTCWSRCMNSIPVFVIWVMRSIKIKVISRTLRRKLRPHWKSPVRISIGLIHL